MRILSVLEIRQRHPLPSNPDAIDAKIRCAKRRIKEAQKIIRHFRSCVQMYEQMIEAEQARVNMHLDYEQSATVKD